MQERNPFGQPAHQNITVNIIVDEFVNDSSFWHLPHVETSQKKNTKVMAEKFWLVALTFIV